jgi:hypothetical protein
MESKISEANSHDEIFISVGDILTVAVSHNILNANVNIEHR